MSNKKILTSSILGNALEFYDFTLYGVFVPVISQTFFPAEDVLTSQLAGWGAFAAAFFMRPFGAFVFGWIGDRFGRKPALALSILLMGFPTLIIALLPGYETLGFAAPLILILCRLLQGLCTGGEYNGAAIFALEHIGQSFPGFAGGLITGSCVVGALLATTFGSITTHPDMPEWAWRGAFLFGAGISFLGYYIRRYLSETPEFLEHKRTNKRSPFLTALTQNRLSVLITFFVGSLNGVLSYTLFGFLNTYLSRYVDVPLSEAMKFNLFGLGAFLFSAPFCGLVSDLMRREKYMIYGALGVVVCASPLFLLLSSGNPLSIVTGQILLGFVSGGVAGPQHAYVQKLFPVEDRYSGISFGFCVGMALCGGTAPVLLTHLIEHTGSLMVPGFYLMAYGGICFSALLALEKPLEVEPIESFV